MNIVSEIIKIDAIKLSPDKPFTWTSGIISPIYCDNRKTLSYPKLRKSIANKFVNIIKEKYKDVEVIVGVASAGVPHASIIAHMLNKPLIYIRSDSKGHGLKNKIEGHIKKGSKVVIIEDLISTGKSVVNAINELKECNILGIISIVNYELQISKDNLKDYNVDSIITFNEIINAYNLDDKTKKKINEFIKDPYNYLDK